MKGLNEKTIGIVGGAGPMASCVLNQYLVEACQREFGCKDDQDFPRIINYSYPFSLMLTSSEASLNQTKVVKELEFCLNELNRARGVNHRYCLQHTSHVSA